MTDNTRTQQAREATNRDPADQLDTANAVSVYLGHYSPETHGETDTTDDEADVAFERVLLDQGVLSPTDQVEALHTSYTNREVLVVLAGGEAFTVSARGVVEGITQREE